MRIGRLGLILLAGAVALTACGVEQYNSNTVVLKSSGRIVTEELALTGFDRVRVSQSFDVTITQDDAFAVTVRVDENVREHLDVRLDGKTLVVGLKGTSYSVSGNVTMGVDVTLPSLVAVDLSGASSARLIDVESDGAFSSSVSGASTLSGAIIAGDIRLDLSGSSRAVLVGQAGDVDARVSGSSVADLTALPASNGTVEASGSSQVDVALSGTLDVSASGASRVTYGDGTILGQVTTSGGADVSRR